jgi:hypothetical protein
MKLIIKLLTYENKLHSRAVIFKNNVMKQLESHVSRALDSAVAEPGMAQSD